jgi:hypothetical protein
MSKWSSVSERSASTWLVSVSIVGPPRRSVDVLATSRQGPAGCASRGRSDGPHTEEPPQERRNCGGPPRAGTRTTRIRPASTARYCRRSTGVRATRYATTGASTKRRRAGPTTAVALTSRARPRRGPSSQCERGQCAGPWGRKPPAPLRRPLPSMRINSGRKAGSFELGREQLVARFVSAPGQLAPRACTRDRSLIDAIRHVARPPDVRPAR